MPVGVYPKQSGAKIRPGAGLRWVALQRLERDRSFVLLWAGQTLSALGTEVSDIAIPTAAIFLFHAGALQVGILAALQVLPFAGLGLVIGPYLDRVRKRPIMIAADLGRFVLLGSIPLAAALDVLTLNQLYAVALLTGCCQVVFEVGYQSHLPVLVGRERIMGANSRLYITSTVAGTVGPAVGGFLVQFLGAARAVGADSLSYLASAISIAAMPRPEPALSGGAGSRGYRGELAEGLRFVLNHPVLRRIAAGNAAYTIGWRAIWGIYILYCYRVIHLTPSQVGLLLAAGGVATLAGALLRDWMTTWLGFGRLLFVMALLMGLQAFLIPLAGLGLGAPAMVASMVVLCSAAGSFDVAQLTLRQLLTPDRLQARMNATMRALFWGPRPLGFLLGGVLGSAIGLVPTTGIGAGICTLAAFAWFTPRILEMRTPPVMADA